MKKILLILGILFITLTAGIFVYLTFFKVTPIPEQGSIQGDSTADTGSQTPFNPQQSNTDSTQEADTATTTNTDTTLSTATSTDEETIVPYRFTQLTREPVVGMTFISTTTARYVTRGAAMIKDISLASGANTTSIDTNITGVIDASLSTDGNVVLLTFIDNATRRYFVGTIQTTTQGERSFRGSLLPEKTIDAAFSGKNSVIRYALASTIGTEIHTYTPKSKTDTLSTTLPYSNPVLAATLLSDSYYVYPTPSAELMGSIQRTSSSTYVTSGGKGLTAYNFGEGILVTKYITSGKLVSYTVIKDKEYGLPQALKTDTCVEKTQKAKTLVCGTSATLQSTSAYPDDWYKGVTRFEDTIVEVGIDFSNILVIGRPREETGISFDIEKIEASTKSADTYLLINKNNGYLWMFRDI